MNCKKWTKMKESFFIKCNNVKRILLTSSIMLNLMKIRVYAESTISTQEVESATANIKDAVIKLAIPIRNCFSIY